MRTYIHLLDRVASPPFLPCETGVLDCFLFSTPPVLVTLLESSEPAASTDAAAARLPDLRVGIATGRDALAVGGREDETCLGEAKDRPSASGE